MDLYHIINEEKKTELFITVRDHLLKNRNRQKLELTKEWANRFPAKPGVYCLFADDLLVYVGETGNIRGRMKDLLNTLNHTCRRTIGELHFSSADGFERATSRKKFPEHIEILLEEWMKNRLTVSYMPIHIGRKEFEEWLQAEMSDIKFYNKRSKRK